MPTIDPFANEGEGPGVGGLGVEDRVDRFSAHGSLDLARSRRRLAQAREPRNPLAAVVGTLEAKEAVPARTGPPGKPAEVEDPFP
jgi:hypothetical protein